MVNPGDDIEDPVYPPGFAPTNTPTQPNAYPTRVSINISPQYQAGVSALTHFPTGSGTRDNSANPSVPDPDDMAEIEKAKGELLRQLEDRYKWLEEKFKALESTNYQCGMDAKELSLVPNLVFPPKFKVPEFEKYNENSCPEAHITMFCRRMTGHVNNDQLLIHCFRDSLIGASAKCDVWGNGKECNKVQKNRGWGKSTRRSAPKKRENEVGNVSGGYAKPITVNQPRVVATGQQASLRQESNTKQNAEKLQFTPIPMTYRELYKSLFDAHVVSPVYLKPLQPSYPKWYDSSTQCEYHAGIIGHSIENCFSFKKLVERLIKIGIVKFDDASGVGNSLPNHTDNGVNAIIENARKRIKLNVTEGVNLEKRGTIVSSTMRRTIRFRGGERSEPLVNEPVTENKAKKFLKFLKHSEYSIVEQLHKQPARISVLVLLLNSEIHRNELMKVLNETYVANDISVNKLDRLVGNINTDNFISFSDDEILLRGMRSTKALHITTQCKGLPIDSSHMKTCQNIVRAFDGTESKVMGRIEIPLLIGPNTYEGLGKSLHGRVEVPSLVGKRDHFGLGHRPDAKQRKEELERKQERRRARLRGAEVKWGSMTFPHISNIFVSGGIIHLEPRMTREGMAKDTMKTLSINAVFEEKSKERNLAGIRPYEPRSVLNNWTAKEIPIVFRANTESPDIDVMSNAAMNPELPWEQDMCLEGPQDFTDDRDCSLSPNLLRMVEREEKLILPHKETIENMILGEGKESYQDMPGLSADIAVHRVPIKEECKPVQQQLRRMRPDVTVKIKEEVKKQFDDGFLQVVNYSEWVANVIPVPKKDGKVRMCVAYRYLNKASPKDNFPLPHIDTLVYNTIGYSLFSLMDGFSGYNQIKMHPEDMKKTTFITLWGTFCYKVMPFELKNAGATYQRAIVTLFHDMMHKEIEVYINDMIAKSRTKKKTCTGFEETILEVEEISAKAQSNQVKTELRSTWIKSRLYKNCLRRALKRKFEITRRLRQYMLYHMTWLISKLDPLKYIMESTALNGRMGRWQILLSEFEIVYVNQKAVKGSAIADFLTSRALDDYKPLNFDFSNEDLMFVAATEEDILEDRPWKLNFDRTSNVVGNGVGAVLISPSGDHSIHLQMVDALATLASMIKVNEQKDMKPIQMSICEAPTHCCNINEEEERDDHLWYHDILRYVKSREYPDQATENDRRTLRRLANDYVLDGEILYKKRKDQVLLKCVDAVEAKKILEEVHEGVCGTHANGFIMAKQIIRFGYYWSTTEGDCIRYSKKCHNLPQCGDGRHWTTVSKFLKKEIICRYVEAINKNIKKIVGKMTETYKDWHEKLPFALYAYRTSVRTFTGATSFLLVYGMEAVLPIEVEIPSIRVLLELMLDESEWIQARRMMRAYNKKVHTRVFHEGDLVLKKTFPMQKDFRWKWMSNWEGPYVVRKVFSRGALILSEMDGKSQPNPVNADSVKKYFA
ncbi:RNA-directed DNA polymerase (Reverse transcriptase), Ribonuclease H-like protein [Gossypium australe]|uniref:RNA-directed DNA polymerase (Reverse transcriptase), Ribonuclease H-like protein n=1 Tax=Gossypium australe TaxID=47621 RepID=A0A5B6WAL5_9ROSI|nr:RNA-directed DNA polymerase (Reverse transcriptase), Ribonuclease H-like protein [Gossypium australe]